MYRTNIGRYKQGGNNDKVSLNIETELESTLGLKNVELHDISDLSARTANGLEVTAVDPAANPQVLTDVKISEVVGFPTEVKAISFYNATGPVKSSFQLDKVDFYGMVNIDRLDLSLGAVAKPVTVSFKPGSLVRISNGISFGRNSGTLEFDNSVRTLIGKVNADAKVTLKNTSSDQWNLQDTVFTVTTGGLEISSQGGSLYLNNSANAIMGTVTGNTDGGSLSIAGVSIHQQSESGGRCFGGVLERLDHRDPFGRRYRQLPRERQGFTRREFRRRLRFGAKPQSDLRHGEPGAGGNRHRPVDRH